MLPGALPERTTDMPTVTKIYVTALQICAENTQQVSALQNFTGSKYDFLKMFSAVLIAIFESLNNLSAVEWSFLTL